MLKFDGRQPIIVQQVEPTGEVLCSGLVLGSLQIALGIFAFVFQAAATGIENASSVHLKVEYFGAGFWCGIMFIITGIQGIRTALSGSNCMIVTFLTFNIFVSVIAVVLFGFSAASVGAGATTKNDNQAWQAMDILLLLLAIFEFAVAITCAVCCCRALSCCCQLSAARPAFVLQPGITDPVVTHQCGSPMQPTFFQQGPSVQDPVFGNPFRLTGQIVYLTEQSPAQMHSPFAQATMPSPAATGASDSSDYFAPYRASAPEEREYGALTTSQRPEYVDIVVQVPVVASPVRGPEQVGLSSAQMHLPFAQTTMPTPAAAGASDSSNYCAPDTASASEEREYCALTASERPEYVDIEGPSVQVPVVANKFRGPEQVGFLTELSPAQMYLPFAQAAIPSPAATGASDSNNYCAPDTDSAPEERLYCALTASEHPDLTSWTEKAV